MDFETDIDCGLSFVVAARWPDGGTIERSYGPGSSSIRFRDGVFLQLSRARFSIFHTGEVEFYTSRRNPDSPSVISRMYWFLLMSAPPFWRDPVIRETMLLAADIPYVVSNEEGADGRSHAIFPGDIDEKILSNNQGAEIAGDLTNELYQLLDEAHPFWRPIEDFREWAIEYFPGENWREG